MLLTVREDRTALSVSPMKDLQTGMDEWLNGELHIRPSPIFIHHSWFVFYLFPIESVNSK